MKISEKDLKQIIIEALEEEAIDEVIDEAIMDKVRGVAGGLKGLGGAAVGGVKSAAGAVTGAYKKGSYGATKDSSIADALKALEKLKISADKFDKDEDFKTGLEGAVKNLRVLKRTAELDPATVASPAEKEVAASDDFARRVAPPEKKKSSSADDEKPDEESAAAATEEPAKEPAKEPAAAATPAAAAATPAAAAATPAAAAAATPAAAAAATPAEAKPQINVFRGKGGKGVQSQMAKAGVKGKDLSRILKGLKGDLAGAGFDVLEEAKRKEISLDKTLAAIDKIADPAQKEAAKKIIVSLLKKNKVKVSDARLARAKPAEPATPAPEPAKAPEPATPEPAPATPEPAPATPTSTPAGRKKPSEEERKKKKKANKKARKDRQKNRKRKKGIREEEEEMLSESQISRFAIIAGLIKGE